MSVSSKSLYSQQLRAIIEMTNQELQKYAPGDFIEYYYYSDGDTYRYYRIKSIEYGEIKESILAGTKVTHVPRLLAEDLETGQCNNLISFIEGGSIVMHHGYQLPEMFPFFQSKHYGKDKTVIEPLGGNRIRKMDSMEIMQLLKRIQEYERQKKEAEIRRRREQEERRRISDSITKDDIDTLYNAINDGRNT